MNWFVGLVIPKFEEYDNYMVELPKGLRSFHPEDLHLTVAFLGNCGHKAALHAWEKLVQEVYFMPFPLMPGALVPFGSPKNPSAYSIVPTIGKEMATKLIARYRDPFLQEVSAKPDLRPPQPHITIVRPSRNSTTEEQKQHLFWANNLHFPESTSVIHTLALYTWADDRRVKQFKIVAEQKMD
ncbi:MAG TPA: hypothetical protein PLO56_00175 [Rhodothermales bacterium]|nr:hypothetical protein [Rhodothermales bacterium]